MSEKIEKDGKTYIVQSKVESIIQERVAKHAAAKAEAESQLEQFQKQIKQYEKRISSAEDWEKKVTDLEGQLATVQKKHQSYTSISSRGITNPQIVELMEWQHQKSGTDKQIGDWLQEYMENPSSAPLSIRPHLEQLGKNGHQEQISDPPTTSPEPEPVEAPQAKATPKPSRSLNSGTIPNPGGSMSFEDLMKNWETNRENVMNSIKRR